MKDTQSPLTISLRISTPALPDIASPYEMYELVKEYSGLLDQVAFFTGIIHSVPAIDTVKKSVDVLSELIPRVKALGIRAGINHLSTLGHHEENVANSLQGAYQRMMGIDGGICAGCLCPSSEATYAHTAKVYQMLAGIGPDFIWVDDDVRVEGHAPVGFACFCDHCLSIFSEETGVEWTREKLNAALNPGSAFEALKVRKQWIEHNRNVISNLLKAMREAVEGVDDSITLGFMSSDLVYSGMPFVEWADALSDNGKNEIMWRPGGGFYFDNAPGGLITKAHSIGRQVVNLQPYVTDIQSEIENFPYDRLKKSTHIMGVEIAAYIAAGCNGAALNVVGTATTVENNDYLDKARECVPFYRRIVEVFGRSKCEGIWSAMHRDSHATLGAEGNWFDAAAWYSPEGLGEMSEMGLPAAYRREDAAATLLSGDSVLAFSEDELREVLSAGVVMDTPALSRLNEMGFSEYTGFEVADARRMDTMEHLSGDELNGEYAGIYRDCRQSFGSWWREASIIRPTGENTRVLSEAVDYAYKEYGPLSGVFENSLGGRVAVFGYYPWTFVQMPGKAWQVKNVIRWASRDSLPVYVATLSHRIALWCRRDNNGNPALLMINTSLDPACDVRVHLRNAQGDMKIVSINGSESTARCVGKDGAYSVYSIDRLEPWEVALIV